MKFNKTIICGPRDPLILLEDAQSIDSDIKLRLGSKNPNSVKPTVFLPFSTNGQKIFNGEHFFDPRDFFSFISEDDRVAVVLTAKEYYLLIELIEDFERPVIVLETAFPIFNNIHFSSDIVKTLSLLKHNVEKIRKLGVDAKTLSRHFSIRHQYRVERALRFKNKLDKFFSFSDPASYQEVFKLKESRKNRKIIAFDFNSMFLDCMKGEFASPKDTYYESWNKTWLNEKLKPGLYHVILQGSNDDFFQKFHPFRYTIANRSWRFWLSKKNNVETLLYHNELAEYAKFFDSVFVKSSIVSDYSIEHPLLRSGEKVYKKRVAHRKSGNDFSEKMAKYEIQLMHSSTSIKQKVTLSFNTTAKMLADLRNKYWLQFFESVEYNEYRICQFVKDDEVIFFRRGKNRLIRVVNIESKINLFSLSRNVVANSRVKMLKTIKQFSEFPSIEICYANVDSIHVSVASSEFDGFMKSASSLIGDNPGKLKIEAIADEGYWFDVGRYWLIKDGEVVAFKNSTLNSKSSKTPFTTSRLVKFITRTPYFSSINKRFISIGSLFSYKKKVDSLSMKADTIDFSRFKFEKISDATLMDHTVKEEIDSSHFFKKKIYESISSHQKLYR